MGRMDGAVRAWTVDSADRPWTVSASRPWADERIAQTGLGQIVLALAPASTLATTFETPPSSSCPLRWTLNHRAAGNVLCPSAGYTCRGGCAANMCNALHAPCFAHAPMLHICLPTLHPGGHVDKECTPRAENGFLSATMARARASLTDWRSFSCS